jgi:hypothetical protein
MEDFKKLIIAFACLCLFLCGVVWLEDKVPKQSVTLLIGAVIWVATIWHYKTKDKKRSLRAGMWVQFARDTYIPDKWEGRGKIKVPKGTLAILKRNFLPKDYRLTAWQDVVVQTEGVGVYFEKGFSDKGNPKETYQLFKDPWLFHAATPPTEVRVATEKAMQHDLEDDAKWRRHFGIDLLDEIHNP